MTTKQLEKGIDKVRTIKHSKGDLVFLSANNLILFMALLVTIYPLIYILSSSFSSTRAVISGRVWLWPVEPTLAGYEAVFNNSSIIRGYINSVIYTFVGTLINVVLTVMAAYPLSRRDFKAGKFIMFMFTFTMFFGGGLIPNYLLIKNLGMINTMWAMVIPGAIGTWNVIITRTYFQSTLPGELLEASQIDGCSDIKFLLKVALPLSKAIIAVITLFYAVGHWNAFFSAFIYLNDKKMFPLQLVLRDILVSLNVDASMLSSLNLEEMTAKEGLVDLVRYSAIVIASVPVMLMYTFAQKYFVQGVMVGAIKG